MEGRASPACVERRPWAVVVLAVCLGLVVAACGADEVSLSEYVESLNDAVVVAEERAEQFRAEGVLADDSTPQELSAGLRRLQEEIRIPLQADVDAIDPPEQVAEHLNEFAQAGVDQVIFIQQGGKNQHEHICDAMRLFAEEIMPQFKAQEAEREAAKAAELAPYIEAALARKPRMPAIPAADIPVVSPYGRNIIQEDQDETENVTHHGAADITVPLRDPLADERAQAVGGDG